MPTFVRYVSSLLVPVHEPQTISTHATAPISSSPSAESWPHPSYQRVSPPQLESRSQRQPVAKEQGV
ncbi:hypothetical protein BJX99DRAFT_222633 [Aspergillus californicus]